MQGRPQADEVPQGIDSYEQMMNTFTEQAKTFWKETGSFYSPTFRELVFSETQHIPGPTELPSQPLAARGSRTFSL